MEIVKRGNFSSFRRYIRYLRKKSSYPWYLGFLRKIRLSSTPKLKIKEKGHILNFKYFISDIINFITF